MKNNIIYLFFAALLFVACHGNQKEIAHRSENIPEKENGQKSEAYYLLRTQCYACHSVNAPSHDEIIAPPMAAVKMRYSRVYDNKDDFIAAVSKWVMNPEQENALMRGAVEKFNVMPKQNFKEDEIKKIAAYIFENKLEEPEWFDAHQQQMHGKKGNGRGMRMGRNN